MDDQSPPDSAREDPVNGSAGSPAAEEGGPPSVDGPATAAIDPSDPTAPAFDEVGEPVPARTFAPGLDDAAVGVTVVAPPPGPSCGWCGAELADPSAEVCPSCGAALHPVADLPDIPGVTVSPPDVRRAVRDVSPEIRALVSPALSDEIARVGARPELGPPDDATRREMLELRLRAERAEAAARAAAEATEAALEAREREAIHGADAETGVAPDESAAGPADETAASDPTAPEPH